MKQGAAQVEVFYRKFYLILQDKDDSLKDVLKQFSMIRDIDLLERKVFKQLLSKQPPPRYHVPIESTDSTDSMLFIQFLYSFYRFYIDDI